MKLVGLNANDADTDSIDIQDINFTDSGPQNTGQIYSVVTSCPRTNADRQEPSGNMHPEKVEGEEWKEEVCL